MKRFLTVFVMFVLIMTFFSGAEPVLISRGRALSNEDIEVVVSNLLSAPSVPAEKRPHVAVLARNMLGAGYELTFTAGLIANFIREGNIGYFESMNYATTTTLTYVRHMKGLQYDTGHWEQYGKWAGKAIYGNDKNGDPINLYEVDALVEQLIAEGHTTAIFGMGCLQWTYFTRIRGLMQYYKQYASGDHITEQECIAAELAFLQYELTGSYHYVYNKWYAATVNDLETVNGAYNAGYYICWYYEGPSNKEGTSSYRGQLASLVYADMVVGTEQGEDMIPDEESPLVNKVTVAEKTAGSYTLVCDVSDNVGVVRVRVAAWDDTDGIDGTIETSVLAGGVSAAQVTVTVNVPEEKQGKKLLYHSRVTAYDAAGNASPVVSAPSVLLLPDDSGTGVMMLPAGLTTVGESAFEGIAAEVVVLPAKLRSLPPLSFGNCRNLHYVVMPPDALITINSSAFDNCVYSVVYQ